ncbi:MAG: hypothetical protein J1E83_08930 [Lachnospiraceae bacterium]|nr:hypothetical protein [Lachnospiraceae bacterium]
MSEIRKFIFDELNTEEQRLKQQNNLEALKMKDDMGNTIYHPSYLHPVNITTDGYIGFYPALGTNFHETMDIVYKLIDDSFLEEHLRDVIAKEMQDRLSASEVDVLLDIVLNKHIRYVYDLDFMRREFTQDEIEDIILKLYIIEEAAVIEYYLTKEELTEEQTTLLTYYFEKIKGTPFFEMIEKNASEKLVMQMLNRMNSVAKKYLFCSIPRCMKCKKVKYFRK